MPVCLHVYNINQNISKLRGFLKATSLCLVPMSIHIYIYIYLRILRQGLMSAL